MFKATETVLVQFRLPVGVKFPKVIREDDPETLTDMKARQCHKTGKDLLARSGVIPSGTIQALTAGGLSLIDARSQERVNGIGKRRVLVTFTFGRVPTVTPPRRDELESEGVSVLAALLNKRWGEGKVVKFTDKEKLRVVMFAHEVEHPQDPRVVEDSEASAAGFVVTKPRPKHKAA